MFIEENAIPKPETITKIMTIAEIYEKIALMESAKDFTAVVFATITKFELNGGYNSIKRKCVYCRKFVLEDQMNCTDQRCQQNFCYDKDKEKFYYSFDISTQLTDKTDATLEARVSGKDAERILGITISDFQNATKKENELRKWKFLLEKFKIKIYVKKPNSFRKDPVILIVDLLPIELSKFSKEIKDFYR